MISKLFRAIKKHKSAIDLARIFVCSLAVLLLCWLWLNVVHGDHKPPFGISVPSCPTASEISKAAKPTAEEGAIHTPTSWPYLPSEGDYRIVEMMDGTFRVEMYRELNMLEGTWTTVYGSQIYYSFEEAQALVKKLIERDLVERQASTVKTVHQHYRPGVGEGN